MWRIRGGIRCFVPDWERFEVRGWVWAGGGLGDYVLVRGAMGSFGTVRNWEKSRAKHLPEILACVCDDAHGGAHPPIRAQQLAFSPSTPALWYETRAIQYGQHILYRRNYSALLLLGISCRSYSSGMYPTNTTSKKLEGQSLYAPPPPPTRSEFP